MARGIKYPPSAIRKCDREIKDLLTDIISTKTGGTTVKGQKGPSRKLRSNTGKLLDSIKPIIKVKGGELFIDIEVVKYYQYLDTGSINIKYPWFLTEELINSAAFLDSIAKLETAGIVAYINENIGKDGENFV